MLYQSKYGDYEVELEFGVYPSTKATEIQLVSAEEGPVAWATINSDDERFGRLVYGVGGHRYVAVKDYGENEGMLRFLLDNDVIEPDPVYSFHSGFVVVCVYELTERYAQFAKALR